MWWHRPGGRVGGRVGGWVGRRWSGGWVGVGGMGRAGVVQRGWGLGMAGRDTHASG